MRLAQLLLTLAVLATLLWVGALQRHLAASTAAHDLFLRGEIAHLSSRVAALEQDDCSEVPIQQLYQGDHLVAWVCR